MSNGYYQYYDTGSNRYQNQRASLSQYQNSSQAATGNQCQDSGRTPSNNVNQQSSYRGYDGTQSPLSQQWYGDPTNSGSGRPSDPVSAVSASGGAQERGSSPVDVPQYAVPQYDNAIYASTTRTVVSSPQLANTMATATGTNGSTSVRHQSQDYSSAPTYGSLSNSYQSHQSRPTSTNPVRSTNATPQHSPVTETFSRSAASAPQYQRSAIHPATDYQRSLSPAQIEASYSLQRLGHAAQNAASTSANQYNVSGNCNSTQISSKQLNGSPYGNSASASLSHTTDYNQSNTVDPTAVYDPWPEYQRQQEASRKVKEAEDAKKKAASEALEAERKAEEERRQAEEEKKQRAEEARQKADHASRVKEATIFAKVAAARAAKEQGKENGEPTKQRKRKSKGSGGSVVTAATTTTNADAAPNATEETDAQAEAELEALMAKIREMHAKHPALLSKRWEVERQHHLQKVTPGNYEVPQTQAAPKRKRGRPRIADATQAATPSVNTTPGIPAPPSPQTTSPAIQRPKPTSTPIPQRPTSSSNTPQGVSKPAQPQQTHAPAVQAAPGQNQNQKKPGTQWPQGEKKDRIAAAAARYVLERRTEQSLPTDADVIAEKLDHNPSYVELCEWLETRGFKIERDLFARAMLRSVPDLNSTTQTANNRQPPAPIIPPTRQSPSQTSQRPASTTQPPNIAHRHQLQSAQSPSVPPPSQINGVQHYVNGSWQARPHAQPPSQYNVPSTYRSPYFGAQPVDDQSSITPYSRVPGEYHSVREEKKPSEPPGSKQDAARKRAFADIVDLTAVSEDDLPPPPKRQDIQQAPQGFPPAVYVPSQPGSTFVHPLERGYIFPGPAASMYPISQPPGPHGLQPGTEPPRGYFDVSQPQPSRLQTFIQDRFRNEELGKSIDKKNAMKRNRYDIRTISRDVLLATGRHPEMAPLNAHLEVLKATFPKQITDNTDLATIRWDLIDPGDPIAELAEVDRDSVIEEDDADDEMAEERPAVVRPAVQTAVGVGASNAVLRQRIPPSVVAQKGALKIKRPRGRPPGTRRSEGDGIRSRPSAPGGDLPAETRPLRSVRPNPTNTMAVNGNQNIPSGAPGVAWKPGMTYSEYRAAMEAAGTPLPKTRGRPVGWRKNPAKAASNMAKPKPKPVDRKPPDVKFPEFICEWDQCGTRLHNLETLQKHVTKLHPHPKHRDGRDLWECLWAECGKRIQTIDEEDGEPVTELERFEFNAIPKLHDHIQQKHINPVAWRLGDGPKGGTSDQTDTEMSEAYLSDAHGRQVTPKIVIPNDADELPSAPMSVPRGRGRPPAKSPYQKAKESEEAAIAKKKQIGAGLDKGGARLANAKRRQGFQDDEDFEMVVDDDE